jgi:hypothetical protein
MMCFGFTSIFFRPICHADEMLEYFTWEDLATSNVAGHGYYQAVETITAAAPSPAEYPSWSVLGPMRARVARTRQGSPRSLHPRPEPRMTARSFGLTERTSSEKLEEGIMAYSADKTPASFVVKNDCRMDSKELCKRGIVCRVSSRKLPTRPTMTKLFQRQPLRIKSEAIVLEGFSQNRFTSAMEFPYGLSR